MQEYILKDVKLILLPDKAIYLPDDKTLLLADLHLGKVNHFRRSGIPVPTQTNDKNLDRLIALLQGHQPERVIFLGDLFHSHYNPEWEIFGQVLKSFPEIKFELVIGNHDIMSEYQYLKHQIEIIKDPLPIGPFTLSHEPLESFEGYNLAGHVHPAVRLRGKARQGMRLPCFYFGKEQGLLPAFGEFTGTHSLKPKKEDTIFVILEDKVLAV